MEREIKKNVGRIVNQKTDSGFTESGNAFHNKQPLVEKEKNTIKNTIEEKKKEILSLARQKRYKEIAERVINDESGVVTAALKKINEERMAELNEDGKRRENEKLTNNDIAVVIKALLNGADVNARIDGCGTTILMCVAASGYTELAKLLIKLGADVNARDYYDGWTALACASVNGHTKMIELLRQEIIKTRNYETSRKKSKNSKSKDGQWIY